MAISSVDYIGKSMVSCLHSGGNVSAKYPMLNIGIYRAKPPPTGASLLSGSCCQIEGLPRRFKLDGSPLRKMANSDPFKVSHKIFCYIGVSNIEGSKAKVIYIILSSFDDCICSYSALIKTEHGTLITGSDFNEDLPYLVFLVCSCEILESISKRVEGEFRGDSDPGG